MASGRPPGAILERFWLDFGCSGGLSGTIFRACFEAFVLQLVAALAALFSLVGLAFGGKMRSDPAKSAGESRAKTHEALPERKKGKKKDIKKERLKNNETRKNTRPLASASVFWSRFPFHANTGNGKRVFDASEVKNL